MIAPDLTALLREVFPDAELPADIDGLEIGAIAAWDSLGHFNLMMAVEEAYGARFSLDEMAALTSVTLICRALRERGLGQ
jgi:acyl carrier protein